MIFVVINPDSPVHSGERWIQRTLAGKYTVLVRVNGSPTYGGTFDTLNEAILVRDQIVNGVCILPLPTFKGRLHHITWFYNKNVNPKYFRWRLILRSPGGERYFSYHKRLYTAFIERDTLLSYAPDNIDDMYVLDVDYGKYSIVIQDIF